MLVKSCKVCKSINIKNISHKVYKCKDCQHTYINYTRDGIKYHRELYRNPGHHGTRGAGELQNGIFTKLFHERRIPICNKRVKILKETLPTIFSECHTLLDIGAGGGTFLDTVKQRFTEVECTEVSDLCINNLKERGYVVYPGSFTKINLNKTYDLVTCWHVLEHVENLEQFLKKAIEVTNKYLVLEVPINRKLKNPDKDFDGHFHYFSSKSLELLFKKDFHILNIRDGVQMPCLYALLQKKNIDTDD